MVLNLLSTPTSFNTPSFLPHISYPQGSQPFQTLSSCGCTTLTGFSLLFTAFLPSCLPAHLPPHLIPLTVSENLKSPDQSPFKKAHLSTSFKDWTPEKKKKKGLDSRPGQPSDWCPYHTAAFGCTSSQPGGGGGYSFHPISSALRLHSSTKLQITW